MRCLFCEVHSRGAFDSSGTREDNPISVHLWVNETIVVFNECRICSGRDSEQLEHLQWAKERFLIFSIGNQA
jgi:hypothetical protein